MHIGLIGAGRMGSGVALRLVRGGHTVTVYNRTYAKTEGLMAQGTAGVHTLEELVSSLKAPRVIWLYLPAGDVTKTHLQQLRELLSPGDIILDGGNSRFTDSHYEAAVAAEKGLHFLDVGTSGGIGGLENGFCLMSGGEVGVYQALQPLWDAVAIQGGSVLAGPAGSGHYVKMVHNAIEYGMLQAYAEGVAIMESGETGEKVNIKEVAEVWQHGSIIESRIGGWVRDSLNDPENLNAAKLSVDENGESRWALEEAINQKVAAPVIAASLFARFSSQSSHPHIVQLVNAVRNRFGGHILK